MQTMLTIIFATNLKRYTNKTSKPTKIELNLLHTNDVNSC